MLTSSVPSRGLSVRLYYEFKPYIFICIGFLFQFFPFIIAHCFFGVIFSVYGGYILGMRGIYRRHVPRLRKRIKHLEQLDSDNWRREKPINDIWDLHDRR